MSSSKRVTIDLILFFWLLDSNRSIQLHEGLLIRPSDVELLDNGEQCNQRRVICC